VPVSQQRRLVAGDIRPGPGCDLDLEVDVGAVHISSQVAGRASLGDSGLHGLERARVLGSHVDEALAGAAGQPCEGEPFEDPRRVSFHEQSVRERPRITLVTVGDDEAPAATSFPGDGGPLLRSREAGAATAAQAGHLHLVEDSLRAASFPHCSPGLPGRTAVENPPEDDGRRVCIHGNLRIAWRRAPGDLVGNVCTHPGFSAIQRSRPAEAVAQAMNWLH
jgi:hypothetical protein